MIRRISPVHLAVDLVLAVVAVALRLALPADPPLFVVAVVGFGVAFAIHRLSPAIALAVAWVAAITQMATGIGPDAVNLAVLVVLYSTARHGTPPLRWIGAASAVVGAAVAAAFLVGTSGGDGGLIISAPGHAALQFLLLFFGFFAVLGLSWTIGLLVRSIAVGREAKRTQEEAERVAVIEQERNRIARDMHDVVAHSLAVVIAQADGARYAAATDPSAAGTALSTIATTAREALADVRLLLGQLRNDWGTGPQPTLDDLPALVAQVRGSGLDVTLELDLGEGELAASHQLAVFRIVQEALTNALRHADPSAPVAVAVTGSHGVVEVVVDSALRRGEPLRTTPGHGITGMRERAFLVGGTLEAAVVDTRFVVKARIPARAEVGA